MVKAKTTSSPLEVEIQRTICDYLFAKGYLFWRSNNTPIFTEGKFRALPKYTPRGLSDIIVVLKGQIVCIEVKRQGTKQTDDQKFFEDRMIMHGGRYFVARSLDDVQAQGL